MFENLSEKLDKAFKVLKGQRNFRNKCCSNYERNKKSCFC